MKRYLVNIPITGFVTVEVEANNEDDAIDNALESDITIHNVEEWNTHRHVVKGNVFYGTLREAEAEEI